MKDLTSYITDVTALNEHKTAIIGLLNALQKPLTEQLSAPPGQADLEPDRGHHPRPERPRKRSSLRSACPITLNAENVTLPDSFAFADPLGNGNSKLDRYKSGDISAKPAAIPVVSRTFDKMCPSESNGKAAKLAVQLGTAIDEINGDAKAGGDQQMVPGNQGRPPRAGRPPLGRAEKGRGELIRARTVRPSAPPADVPISGSAPAPP